MHEVPLGQLLGGLPLPDDELLGLLPELDDRPQPV